jgi:DNA-directed RNA polymerase subunit RPC12/RpoP
VIRFVCTLCSEIISVRDQLAGRQINCPKCDGVRLVPDKSPKMKFHCHSCGQSVRVEQIHAGKKGTCPKCRKLIDIPPHPEGTMVALVCSICNEIIHVPEDSKEKIIECPKCGSYIEGLSKEN